MKKEKSLLEFKTEAGSARRAADIIGVTDATIYRWLSIGGKPTNEAVLRALKKNNIEKWWEKKEFGGEND